jgi:hypothetical protein
LDKFSRYYAYFLLFATIVPAAMRLLQNKNLAEITSERMSKEKSRGRYRWMGWISVIIAIGMFAAYLAVWRHTRWLVLAAVIGVVSGAEMVGNANSPDKASLERQNVMFGVAYVFVAIATYFFLLR